MSQTSACTARLCVRVRVRLQVRVHVRARVRVRGRVVLCTSSWRSVVVVGARVGAAVQAVGAVGAAGAHGAALGPRLAPRARRALWGQDGDGNEGGKWVGSYLAALRLRCPYW